MHVLHSLVLCLVAFTLYIILTSENSPVEQFKDGKFESGPDLSGNYSAGKLNSQFDLKTHDPNNVAGEVDSTQKKLDAKKDTGVKSVNSHTSTPTVQESGELKVTKTPYDDSAALLGSVAKFASDGVKAVGKAGKVAVKAVAKVGGVAVKSVAKFSTSVVKSAPKVAKAVVKSAPIKAVVKVVKVVKISKPKVKVKKIKLR